MKFKTISFQLFLVQIIIGMTFTITENISYKSTNQFSKVDNETFIIFEKHDNMFKSMSKFLSESSLPIIKKIFDEVNVSSTCEQSLFRLLSDLREMKAWTFKMFDSFGKFPGVFSGTLWFRGDYDQCLNIEEGRNNLRKSNRGDIIYGRFCAIDVGYPELKYEILKETKKFGNLLELLNNLVDPFNMEQGIKTFNYKKLKFRFDVCIPSACTQIDIENIARWVVQEPNKVDVQFCKMKEEKMEFSLAQTVCLIIFGYFALWVTFGTFIESLFRFNIFPLRDDKNAWLECVFSISMYASYKRFFSNRNLEKTKFFCGIKFFIVCLVILCHVLVFVSLVPTISEYIFNLKYLVDELPVEIISQGMSIMETFFIISGFLTFFVRRNNEKHSINYYFIFIIKRFIRLTLPLFCVLSLMIILPLLGDGPHWEHVKEEGKKAEKYWWRFILHIQNLYNPPLDFTVHLWFLNALMQLIFLTLPLLFITDRWPKIGKVFMFGLMLSGIVSHIYYMLISEYVTILGIAIDVQKLENYFLRNYRKPYYTHISSYCLGMLIGNIFYERKDMKFGKKTVITFWIGTLILVGFVLLGLHSYRTDPSPNEIFIHIHQALSPIAWMTVAAWGIIACISGYSDTLKKFLSLDIFVVLDPLLMWMYLLHPLCLLYIFGELRSPQPLTKINLSMLFSLVMVFTVIASVLFYIFLETPLNYISSKLFLSIGIKKRSRKEEVSKL